MSLKIAVLISGGGSNLKAILEECSTNPDYPVEVAVVGADRNAAGLEHAKAHSVPSFVLSTRDFSDRASWGTQLIKELEPYQVDLVLSAGLMKILPENFVSAFSPNLINSHPSYLPDFPGAHAVRDALAAGASETGVSIFVVDNGIDTGPMIVQQRIPIIAGDSEAELHERIKVVERKLLVQTLQQISDGTIDLTRLV